MNMKFLACFNGWLNLVYINNHRAIKIICKVSYWIILVSTAALMALADKLVEMKGICHCGKKATMVLRVDKDGNVVRDGAQIQVGAEDKYVSVCRKHFIDGTTQ